MLSPYRSQTVTTFFSHVLGTLWTPPLPGTPLLLRPDYFFIRVLMGSGVPGSGVLVTERTP